MKREFIVERHGRSFVLYVGLLKLAHERGLISITTELVQAPSVDNGGVAICLATAVFCEDGIEKRFTGIGDASVANVSHAMQTSLIRMAETRAKARALRDGVNLDVSVLEESPELDSQADAAPAGDNTPKESRGYRPARTGAVPARPELRPATLRSQDPLHKASPRSDEVEDQGITADQTNAIISICRIQDLDSLSIIGDRYPGATISSLTRVQAGDLIKHLSSVTQTRRLAVTA